MENAPYKDENGLPKLHQSIVGFFDVLGFTKLFKNKKVQEQDDIIKKFYKSWESAKTKSNINSKNARFFSDNVLLSIPFGQETRYLLAYTDIYRKIIKFQLEMILNGFFIRGGITKGNISVADDFIAGDALIEAYEVESKEANYPRIILSDNLANGLVNYNENLNEKFPKVSEEDINRDLLKDCDGKVFINYLNFAENNEKIINTHKEKIEENLELNKNIPDILEKYKWVLNYHNYYCKSNELDNLMVDTKLLTYEFKPLIELEECDKQYSCFFLGSEGSKTETKIEKSYKKKSK